MIQKAGHIRGMEKAFVTTGKPIFKCWEPQKLISCVHEHMPALRIEAILKKNTTTHDRKL